MHFSVPLFPVRCAQFKNYKSKHENFTLLLTWPHNLVVQVAFFVVRVCVCAVKANRHTVRWELERAATKRKEIHCSVRQTKNHNVWVDFVVDRRFPIECHTFLCVATVFQIFAFGTLLTINYRLCQSTRQKIERSFFIFWLLPKESQRLENFNPLSMCIRYLLVRNFILYPFRRLLVKLKRRKNCAKWNVAHLANVVGH